MMAGPALTVPGTPCGVGQLGGVAVQSEIQFTGIDLSSAHIMPSTWRKLKEWEDDIDAPLTCKEFDNGHSVLVFVYSADTDDTEIPSELRDIIKEAWRRQWRIIMFDSDGQESGLFPLFWDEWKKGEQRNA